MELKKAVGAVTVTAAPEGFVAAAVVALAVLVQLVTVVVPVIAGSLCAREGSAMLLVAAAEYHRIAN